MVGGNKEYLNGKKEGASYGEPIIANLLRDSCHKNIHPAVILNRKRNVEVHQKLCYRWETSVNRRIHVYFYVIYSAKERNSGLRSILVTPVIDAHTQTRAKHTQSSHSLQQCHAFICASSNIGDSGNQRTPNMRVI